MKSYLVITELNNCPDQRLELSLQTDRDAIDAWLSQKSGELMANGAVDPNDMDRSCGAVRLVFDGDYLHMGEVGADLENTYLEEHWLWPEISESLGCDDPLAIDPFDVIRYVLQRKS